MVEPLTKKFRKKPVIIEAVQLTDKNKDMVSNWITCNTSPVYDEDNRPAIKIQTLEGDMVAKIGDWIIKGIAGEFYPCKERIFNKSYEEVKPE